VTGTRATLTVADGAQVFTLVVLVDAATPDGTLIDNIADVSAASTDPNPINNSFIAITTVAAPVPSVPDAAMPEPASGSPLLTLGFAAVLLGMLAGATVLSRRRSTD
jgi:hypothetical protein